MTSSSWERSVPDGVGDLDDAGQLPLLVVESDGIAADAAGEAALGAERQPLERHDLGGLVDPALELVGARCLRHLGADEPEDHALALRYVAERREIAGPRRIVFEEKDVD